MNEQQEKILQIINDYHKKTDGKCGITAIQIAHKLDLTFSDIRDSLNDLYKNKKFITRRGLNNVLIFKE